MSRQDDDYSRRYREQGGQGSQQGGGHGNREPNQHQQLQGGYGGQQGGNSGLQSDYPNKAGWGNDQRDFFPGGTFQERPDHGGLRGPGTYGPQSVGHNTRDNFQGGYSEPYDPARQADSGPRQDPQRGQGQQGSYGHPGGYGGQTNYSGQVNPGSGYRHERAGQHEYGEYDPDYHQWRSEQMRALDDDYRNWRQDRYKKFSDDFSTWRQSRQQPSAGSTPSSGIGDESTASTSSASSVGAKSK